ncbi:hypothetical protein AMR42_02460 [Limnothrix sp. PR1529]|nr:hypothetical protein BCR12_18495 [Limnothrix sp. P13C2]PIB15160.1 hypothetical protein AMR42_02460 [Limnothrix sp. PR1529]
MIGASAPDRSLKFWGDRPTLRLRQSQNQSDTAQLTQLTDGSATKAHFRPQLAAQAVMVDAAEQITQGQQWPASVFRPRS